MLLTRGKKEPAEELNSTTVIASVAVAQISNGVDTVLVFSPLVADSRTEIDFSIAAAFIVVTCLWFGLAKFLCFHVSQLEPITRIGRYISPLVMIIVGLYILDNTATDLIAGD